MDKEKIKKEIEKEIDELWKHMTRRDTDENGMIHIDIVFENIKEEILEKLDRIIP